VIVIVLILGLLQGLTEFLPVSSSGHLAIARFCFPEFQSPELLFEILLHFATALAILIFFRKEIFSLIKYSIKPASQAESSISRKVIFLIILASIPTAVIGLLLKESTVKAMKSPLLISIAYLLTGIALLSTLIRKKHKIDFQKMNWSFALIIGIFQGIAVLPGISRSGITIAVALLLGVVPVFAARFSFFIALPAIFGAMLLDSKEMLQSFASNSETLFPFILGMMVAGISGYFALLLLVNITKNLKLHLFAPYCFAVSILLLIIKVL